MAARPQRLRLEAVQWSAHQLTMRFSLDALSFSTVYWYPDIDLLALDARYGRDVMERIHVHSALFEINKLVSYRPHVLDLGTYARHHTAELEALWSTVIHKVWAQWRYENNLPHEAPPRWLSSAQSAPPPLERPDADRSGVEFLLFCGGGKDSLVSMRLMERAGLPFAVFGYSSSVYGQTDAQFALLDRLASKCNARRTHHQIVIDDAFDAPLLTIYGQQWGVKTTTAAETPSSIFGSIPILLSNGYSAAVLGHEASANKGNLIWKATGEDVNHQWGKSVAAEAMLDTYISTHLVHDLHVFSILMPLHDVLIFSLLRGEQNVPFTHSCNLRKPWCKRCAKCCYVWLGFRAHLDDRMVADMFGEDLLECADNEEHFLAMAGLRDHTPFECIGQIEETRLALALCHARKLLGQRGASIFTQLPPLDLQATLAYYARVKHSEARLPARVRDLVVPLMQEAASEVTHRATALLGAPRELSAVAAKAERASGAAM